MNITQLAKAFANDRNGACHNARVVAFNGVTDYRLHGHLIARKAANGIVTFDWCGWYTPTTANHMNEVLRAIGASFRVSYAKARDAGTTVFHAHQHLSLKEAA